MARMIYVNLPVADLGRSMAFYEALGFRNVPQFTDEKAAAMAWSDTIVAMLLTREFWRTFTEKEIPDAHQSAQVMLCVNHDSREAVDTAVEAARAAGGRADPNPAQDMGFMYGRSFEDPDGHIWEPMWMDPQAVPADTMPEAAPA